ncbi:MAG: sigma-70 family RNA polymerase sigma factor [Phycisphaerae bacterium]|nr:sigma-70 family RNA polymerase sigma factor [Gemmatimonadaceae bacterium]
MHSGPSVTDLFARAGAGDRAALDSVLPLVYGELRRLAQKQLLQGDAVVTLNPTALVHEVWLRFAGDDKATWQSRAHFFALAATSMRRIIIDHARRRGAIKRGGAVHPITLDDGQASPIEQRADVLVALDESLRRLERLDARQSRVVECRFFGGMSEVETAEAMGIGLRTVKRDWSKARAWLLQDLASDG